MVEFIKMINDDVVDKERLILKRYQFINIDKVQAEYLSKLFANKEVEHGKVSVKELSNIISIPEKASEALTKELLKKHLIGIKQENHNLYFDFNKLINKLIESYMTPKSSCDINEKLNWSVKSLDFELTEKNINDLKLIIIENGWDNLSSVINKLSMIDNANWQQLMTMYESLGVREKTDSNDIKELLKLNWLEN